MNEVFEVKDNYDMGLITRSECLNQIIHTLSKVSMEEFISKIHNVDFEIIEDLVDAMKNDK